MLYPPVRLYKTLFFLAFNLTARQISKTPMRKDSAILVKSALLAVIATAVFYEVFPLPFINVQRWLVVFDNPISGALVVLASWAGFILGFKWLQSRVEQKAYAAFLQPSTMEALGQGILASQTEQGLLRIDATFSAKQQKSFATTMMRRRFGQLLESLRFAENKEGLRQILDQQSGIDLQRLESAYTPLHVIIWALPLLGFIGTVLGVSDSVEQFSVFVQSSGGNVEFSGPLRAALGGVTSGLAVAFHTTFLALVLVIPVMLVASLLQKSEEELLLSMQEFCLDKVLPNLQVAPVRAAAEENWGKHMQQITQLSQKWQEQMAPLVQGFGHHAEMMKHQLTGLQPIVQDFTNRLLGTSSPASPKAAAFAVEKQDKNNNA